MKMRKISWTLVLVVTFAVGSGCGSSGEDPVCSDGEKRCSGSTSVEVCVNGQWEVSDCPTGQACQSGNCVCVPDCTGKQCGDNGCGGSCGTCDSPKVCNQNGQCEGCVPDCTGKQCGNDGCEGSCGTCILPEVCNQQGQCVESVSPRSGTWYYNEYSASTNDCNSEQLISNGDGFFGLTNKGDGTFTITPTDGTEPFNCTVTGSSFSCPHRLMVEVDLGGGAKLTATAKVTGTFSDKEHMSGQQIAEADCVGDPSDCAAAADLLGTSFPCKFTIDFQAEFTSCVPDCAGKQCGNDGCGGSCGTCSLDEVCNQDDQCEDCVPNCTGKQCGDNGCGGSCGTCSLPEVCNQDGQCEGCVANCTGKQCGDDGCGGSCGTCKWFENCNQQGQCVGNVSPKSGTWYYDEYSASTNDCNSEQLISNGTGFFDLINTGDGTFTIEPTDETEPFNCTVTGSSFSCPHRLMVGVDLGGGAKLTATAKVTGTFSDEEHMSGQQIAEADCVGEPIACDAAADLLDTSFPCEFIIDFQAKFMY